MKVEENRAKKSQKARYMFIINIVQGRTGSSLKLQRPFTCIQSKEDQRPEGCWGRLEDCLVLKLHFERSTQLELFEKTKYDAEGIKIMLCQEWFNEIAVVTIEK